MNPIRKIAIIGATGMLGIPVTVALLDAGFAVTALSRKPDEAGRVLPAATQIVVAPAANSVLQPAMQRHRAAGISSCSNRQGRRPKPPMLGQRTVKSLRPSSTGSMKASPQCCGLPFKWYSNSS
jgi:5,10-methylene-tetrahydrofolate dehydrogenase/methenyl tetrahydrofolate cyclohydrolase